MKVCVLGAGAYALALTSAIYRNTKDITIWSALDNEVEMLKKERGNKKALNYKLPEEISITSNLEEAIANCEVIVIGVACKFVRSVCKELKKYYKNQHIVIASKGIEQDTCLFVNEIVESIIPTKRIAVISGPSFANDLIQDTPTGLALGTKNKKTEKVVTEVFRSNLLNIYPTKDILGIEVCGSVKNVIAIGSGMLSGMGVTFSTKAMFLTVSLHVIKRLIKSLGGNDRTVLSYAGFGDILLTCTSPGSRNYTFGEMIGKKLPKEEIEEYMNSTTIEGLYTLDSVYKLCKKKKIDVPMIKLIYNIIYKNEKPEEVLKQIVKS